MTEDQYDRILEVLFSPGEWFQVPYKLLRLASPNEAVMFSYLAGVSHKFKARENDEWFYRTIAAVKADIGMSEDVQKTAVRKLKARGWIETKRKGLPALRHFRLDLKQVSKEMVDLKETTPDLVRGSSPGTDRGSSPGIYRGEIPDRSRESNRENKEDSLSVQSPDGENGDLKEPSREKKQPSRFDHKCVKELRKAVSTVIKVNSRASLNEWAHQFRLLRQRDGIDRKDIRRAIEWYAVHIGQEYIPEAHSAKAFRTKYVNGQIPAAMKRCDRQPVPDDPYNRTPKEKELDDVRSKLLNGQMDREGRTWKPSQEELDGVLAGMGIEAGKYFPGEI